MTKHPLTNKKIFKKFWDHTVEINMGDCFYTPDGMRAAYDLGRDEQLEKVMKWLDKNLSNYTDNDYLGTCDPFYLLDSHLEDAMRPKKKGKR